MEIAAGIDFGGASAKIGLVNRRGCITAKTAIVMDPGDSFEGIGEPVASQGVKVVAAELRGDAGILGAAAQAFERVGG
jgi:hypothetical protein